MILIFNKAQYQTSRTLGIKERIMLGIYPGQELFIANLFFREGHVLLLGLYCTVC